MKKLLLLALPLLATGFVSCSDDDEPVVNIVECETITFNNCEFPAGKFTNVVSGGNSYTEFGGLFQFAEKYTMVSGCVVSSQHEVADYKDASPKDFSVAIAPAEDADAVANKFAVVAYNSYVGAEGAGAPAFTFENDAERELVSIDVMNATNMYQYMTIGYYSYAPMAAGDWCKATFTGYDLAGTETGTVEVYLADLRNGSSFIMNEWTTVDVSALGKVNKVTVDVTWPDTWTKPSSTSSLICLDNIKMIKE